MENRNQKCTPPLDVALMKEANLNNVTAEQMAKICELRAAGETYSAIGRKVLMSRERVSSICKQKGWH